jgi:hypothetical protein
LESEARMRSEMNFDMQTPMSGAHLILQSIRRCHAQLGAATRVQRPSYERTNAR